MRAVDKYIWFMNVIVKLERYNNRQIEGSMIKCWLLWLVTENCNILKIEKKKIRVWRLESQKAGIINACPSLKIWESRQNIES